MKTNDRYLDKKGQWQSKESPEPEEVIEVVKEPEAKKIEIPRAEVGWLFRLKINLDFARWRRLDKAGLWHKYFDYWQLRNRIATAASNCQICDELYPWRRTQDGGTRYCGSGLRYYGKKPEIVVKCLGCGAESLIKELYGWNP